MSYLDELKSYAESTNSTSRNKNGFTYYGGSNGIEELDIDSLSTSSLKIPGSSQAVTTVRGVDGQLTTGVVDPDGKVVPQQQYMGDVTTGVGLDGRLTTVTGTGRSSSTPDIVTTVRGEDGKLTTGVVGPGGQLTPASGSQSYTSTTKELIEKIKSGELKPIANMTYEEQMNTFGHATRPPVQAPSVSPSSASSNGLNLSPLYNMTYEEQMNTFGHATRPPVQAPSVSTSSASSNGSDLSSLHNMTYEEQMNTFGHATRPPVQAPSTNANKDVSTFVIKKPSLYGDDTIR